MPTPILVNNFGDVRRRLQGQIASEESSAATAASTAAGARTDYTNRLTNFNPQDFLRTSIQGALDEEIEPYMQREDARRADVNARGFGLSNLGAATLRKDLNQRIANRVNASALEAANLENSRIQQFGSLYQSDANRADAAHERALDLSGADSELAIAEENRKREEKAKKKRGLLGLAGGVLGGAAGFFLGGPGGAIAGAKAGSAILGAAGG